MAEIHLEDCYERPAMPAKVEMRLQQVKFNMEDEIKADALVVTSLPNIRYLTNFSGSAATLFISSEEIHFITDDRYEEQVKSELYLLPNMKVHISRDPWGLVTEGKILKNIESIAFESDKLSYADAVQIRNNIRPIKLKPAIKPVEIYTIAKSPEEIANIETSCRMAEKVIETIIPMLKPGVSEKDMAAEITYQGKKLGSEGDAFDVIFVSGERGALVHGSPSEKKINKGDIVLMDFGCIVNGFISDLSRTFAIGSATQQQKDVYKLIVDAKECAIENVRPGMNGKTLDAFARDMIKEAGYGDYFQHSLGHGIGLVAHESPFISFRMNDQIIHENTALAIEPGVYLPNKFGIRVEDNIIVTKNGGRHITTAPSELIILD
jgi:Xaa-Pro aminopeptidase